MAEGFAGGEALLGVGVEQLVHEIDVGGFDAELAWCGGGGGGALDFAAERRGYFAGEILSLAVSLGVAFFTCLSNHATIS
jgi:hypothetical protein